MNSGGRCVTPDRRPWPLVLALFLGVSIGQGTACAQDTDAEAPPPLGILFYTPSTREALDEARRSGRKISRGSGRREAVETRLRVNGMVVPSNGRRTAWVNGRTVRSGDELSEGLRVTVEGSKSGTVRLKTPDKGEVKVKPGESIQALLNEPLQPPAAMKAPGAEGGQGVGGDDPDSLEARLERIPADVSLRDLISVLLTPEETEATAEEDRSREGNDGKNGGE